MTLNKYQENARMTAIYPPGITYPVLGLASEAGEVAGKFKKILRDKQGIITPEDGLRMAGELGDVLWYVANCAYELGYTLEQVADMNTNKLVTRMHNSKLGGEGDDR